MFRVSGTMLCMSEVSPAGLSLPLAARNVHLVCNLVLFREDGNVLEGFIS